MKRNTLAFSIATFAITSSGAYAANSTSADLGGNGRTYNANMLGKDGYQLGANLGIAYSHDAIRDAQNSQKNVLLTNQEFFASYGIWSWMDASATFPIYQEAVKDFQNDLTGWGDLTTNFRFIHPGLKPNAALKLAYILRISFPTGANHHGYFPREANYGQLDTLNAQSPNSSQGYRLNPNLAWTLDFSQIYPNNPFKINANFGAELNVHRPHVTNNQGQTSAWIARIQFEYAKSTQTSYFTEFYGLSRFDNLTKGNSLNTVIGNTFAQDQLSVALGVNHKYTNGWTSAFSIDAAISQNNQNINWNISRDGKQISYVSESNPKVGANLTIGFGKLGQKEVYVEKVKIDTLIKRDTIKVSRIDTVKIIQKDTVIINKVDTLKVFATQAPDKAIPLGQSTFKNVTFLASKSTITPTSFPILNNVIQSLKNFPEVQLEIIGHTDNQGQAATNQKLSEERAKAVLDYLVSNGIAANRLKSIGMGQTKNIADNNSEQNRELNRRVEFNRTK